MILEPVWRSPRRVLFYFDYVLAAPAAAAAAAHSSESSPRVRQGLALCPSLSFSFSVHTADENHTQIESIKAPLLLPWPRHSAMSSLALALLLLIWPLPFASVHLALAPLDALVLWQRQSKRCSSSFCLFSALPSHSSLHLCHSY